MTDRLDSIQARELLKEVGWVCRLARHLLVDEHQAEDAAQDTWVAALESPPRDRRNIRAWLGAVLHNVVRQKRRAETARRRRELRRGRRGSFPSPEEVVERAEIHRGVVDAVLGLEEPYQTTILYHFFEDCSAGEIAVQFGVPASTVRTRLKRGLEQLRTRLDRAYGGDRRSWCLALTVFARSNALPAGPATVNAAIWKSLLGWTVVVPIVLALVVGGAVLMSTREGELEPAPTAHRDPVASGTTAAAPVPAADDGRPTLVASGREAPARTPEKLPQPETPSWQRCVRGTVRDDAGAPIAGAVVRALVNAPPFAVETREIARARTSPKGEYRLGPLITDGERSLFVEASAAARFTQREWVSIGTRRDFSLGRPGSLAGRVAVSSDRGACADATVTVFRRKRHDPFDNGSYSLTNQRWCAPDAETRTDGEGRYRFPRLPPGDYRIMVYPNGKNSKGSGPVAVKAGKETVKDLHVSAGEVLWGVITDARTGAPIPGARILTANPRNQATSNELGAYRLPGIVPEVKLWLLVGAEGYFWELGDWAAGHRGAMQQNFTLERAGLVRGRVLGPDGSGVAGAEVAVTWTSVRPDASQRVETDEDGRFEVEHRCRSGLRLRVSADGLALLHSRTIIVLPNQVVDDVVLQMKRGGSLRGRVALPDGEPAAGAIVQIVADEGTCTITVAADDGGYCFPRVHPAVYEVTVIPGRAYAEHRSAFCRYQRKGISIADGVDTRFDVMLSQGAALEGEVVDDGGRPLADVAVFAVPDKLAHWDPRTGCNLDLRRTYTDAAGKFRIVGLTNQYVYTVIARGYAKGHANAFRRKVKPGTGPLRFTMGSAHHVVGKVVRADSGRPAANFWIEVNRVEPNTSTPAERMGRFHCTDPDGRFKLGFNPGTFSLVAGTADGMLSEPRLLDLAGEALEATTDFVVHRAATLKGAVVSPKGRPGIGLVNVYTLVSARPVFLQGVRTDSQGKFEIGSLPPGRYFLEPAKSTQPRWVAESVVSLSAGGRAEVRLQYAIGGELLVSVRDPEGRPVSGAWVRLKHEDGRIAILDMQRYRLEIDRRFYPNPTPSEDWTAFCRSFFFTDASGAVHPRYPAAGRYVVEAIAAGYRLQRVTTVVQSGTETKVEITLEKE